MGTLIKNAVALRNGKLTPCSLLIKKDRIKSFSFRKIRITDDEILNADGLFLMPGVIDPHVHLREPGLTQKEDLLTGSHAAVAGGITTVFDMPNTIPPTTTLEALKQKKELAKKMVVNHGFYFGGTVDSVKDMPLARNIPGTKVYMDFTTGNHIVQEDDSLKKIFKASKRVAVHAEGMRLKQAIDLAMKTNRRLYCCHTSLAKEISLISQARLKRSGIYCEVAPHHLFMTHDDDNSGYTKMKPPLRTQEDQDALWRAIETGIVDTIGTDHAPHTKKEKEAITPSFGVPGLETSLPLMLTAAKQGRLSYEKVLTLMCRNPAKIFRVKGRGQLRTAFYADLTLVDIWNKKKVVGNELKTKCKWSPFEGMELTGWPQYTFVNGNLVYEKGKINEIPAREVKFL